MKIQIELIPQSQHRYEGTVGDWWIDADGVLQIRASEMENRLHSTLVALHEVVEALVVGIQKTRQLSVPQWLVESVDVFDKQYIEDEEDEPGYSADAPYYEAHMIASTIEHLVAMLLKIDYNIYESAVDSIAQPST